MDSGPWDAWGAQSTRDSHRPAQETWKHSCKDISEAKHMGQSRNEGLAGAQHIPSALKEISWHETATRRFEKLFEATNTLKNNFFLVDNSHTISKMGFVKQIGHSTEAAEELP